MLVTTKKKKEGTKEKVGIVSKPKYTKNVHFAKIVIFVLFVRFVSLFIKSIFADGYLADKAP